ncbi:MAG TPA: hypothetical protein DDZ39_06365, partial [Flavobacteriaceae bacterium]|nr:hypothetical protein [Flavobacteriaceae bacterium]
MKIINKGLKYKMARKFYTLSMILDNSGNCDFNKNGEQNFIQNLFKELKTKTQITLFDIGGNVGDYTQMLFNKAKESTQNYIKGVTIHVFEPTRYCFDKLS